MIPVDCGSLIQRRSECLRGLPVESASSAVGCVQALHVKVNQRTLHRTRASAEDQVIIAPLEATLRDLFNVPRDRRSISRCQVDDYSNRTSLPGMRKRTTFRKSYHNTGKVQVIGL